MYGSYSNLPVNSLNQRRTKFQTPYIGNRGAGRNGGHYSGTPHFRSKSYLLQFATLLAFEKIQPHPLALSASHFFSSVFHLGAIHAKSQLA